MPDERYPVRMRTLISILFGAILIPLPSGCESVTYQATQDGKTTWRSEQLELDENGGMISLSVREQGDDPITVLLLVSNSLVPSEESPRTATPYAAARGVPTNGLLRINFTQLPIASYFVVAFIDQNGDGRLEEGWPPDDIDLDFIEPHSRIQHFHLRDSKRVNISLAIRD